MSKLNFDRLQQQIYDQLCQRFILGEVELGASSSSRSIAAEMGVSPIPVREALTRPTADGAIEQVTSRSSRVRVLSPEDYDELVALRVATEGLACSRAVEGMTEKDRVVMTEVYDFLATAAREQDIEAYLQGNVRFHCAIYGLARWPLVQSTINRLWLIAGKSLRATVPDGSHIARFMAMHERAYAALMAGDSEGLCAAMVRPAVRKLTTAAAG